MKKITLTFKNLAISSTPNMLFRTYITPLIFALVTLSGCSKDDDVTPVSPSTPDSNNFATINGKTFSTPNGYLFDLGKPSKYNSRIFIVDLTNGIYDGDKYSATMTTSISIDFNSPSQTELAEGEYILNQEMDANNLPERKPLTFSDAYAHVDLKYENGNFVGGTRYDDLTGGSVIVKKTSEGYEIDYDLTFNGGFNMKGVYAGNLPYYDVSN
jgi:hypothetical protein